MSIAFDVVRVHLREEVNKWLELAGLGEKDKEAVEIFEGWSETTFQKSLQGWSFGWIEMSRSRRRERREWFGLREYHLFGFLH